jgi:hypothetical protein
MLISQRTLRFGPHTLLAADPGSEVVPYFLAGRKMYYVGMTTGDLQPIGAEHLVGEMGGLWAHPLKVADGLTLLITEPDGTQPMAHAIELIELLSHVDWRYRIGGMEVTRFYRRGPGGVFLAADGKERRRAAADRQAASLGLAEVPGRLVQRQCRACRRGVLAG